MVIEMAVMRSMYHNKRVNVIIVAGQQAEIDQMKAALRRLEQ